MPDHVDVTVTNPWTKQPVVLSLDRYNLRAPDWELRVYNDPVNPTNYLVLPSNQWPEVGTFRGKVSNDPSASVAAGFKPDGRLWAHVNHGCRDTDENEGDTIHYDRYESTDRFDWVVVDSSTEYTLSSGSYGYAWTSNMPTPTPDPGIWTSYFDTPATNFGCLATKNMWRLPLQRARVCATVISSVFANAFGRDLRLMVANEESTYNVVDYLQARDGGFCHQISIMAVLLFSDNVTALPGAGTNYDMIAFSAEVGGGLGDCPGTWTETDAENMDGCVHNHEMSHNMGVDDYVGNWDYTCRYRTHTSETGSGRGWALQSVRKSIEERATNKATYAWVMYHSPLPPWAGADYVSTTPGTPVAVDVLQNDRMATSTNRATMSVVSFETPSEQGCSVTNLGGGWLRYTPRAGFVGDDLFHYYVGDDTGLKSLAAVRVLVHDPADPLRAQFTFDDTAGAFAYDRVQSQTLELVGGSFDTNSVPGVVGRALHLDESNYLDAVATPAAYWYAPMDVSHSFSLWYKPDADVRSEQILYTQSECDGSTQYRCSGVVIGLDSGKVYARAPMLGEQDEPSVYAPVASYSGMWHHVVAEVDRKARLLRLFVDGIEYTSTFSTSALDARTLVVGEAASRLGRERGDDGLRFAGVLDDFLIYSKALTPDEIAGLYAAADTLPLFVAGPVPGNGNGTISFQPALAWMASRPHCRHDVYIGTDQAQVLNATTGTPGIFMGRQTMATWAPGSPLAPGTWHFWRVDEVAGTTVVKGPVWSFKTAVDPLHAGLALHLTLDAGDTSGTNTLDTAGPPYEDGGLSGGKGSPLLTNGVVAGAMWFNGTAACISTKQPLYTETSSATLLAWVKRCGTQEPFAGILFNRGGSSVAGLHMGATNELRYTWNDVSATYDWDSGLVPPEDEWTLAALVVTPGCAIMYMGTGTCLRARTNSVAHAPLAFNAALCVGRDPVGEDGDEGKRCFRGAIDDVMVWDRALSHAELQAILDSAATGRGIGGERVQPPPALRRDPCS